MTDSAKTISNLVNLTFYDTLKFLLNSAQKSPWPENLITWLRLLSYPNIGPGMTRNIRSAKVVLRKTVKSQSSPMCPTCGQLERNVYLITKSQSLPAYMWAVRNLDFFPAFIVVIRSTFRCKQRYLPTYSSQMLLTLKMTHTAMRYGEVQFPEFVLIAWHSIGIGHWWALWWDWDKMTQTEWASVSQHTQLQRPG